MSQTFYLLAERAKNYSSSKGKDQSSERRVVTDAAEGANNYSRRDYRTVDEKRGEGIIVCI